jgi:anthranilate/para-aminobenzoate synthase component I
MSSTKRYAVCALISMAALFAATASHAQSPFDGTWKTDLSKTKFSPKPLTFYISAGWYHCVSCSPAFDVQADGQDHPVAGTSPRRAAPSISSRPAPSLPTAKRSP